jgi:hypothetical protein
MEYYRITSKLEKQIDDIKRLASLKHSLDYNASLRTDAIKVIIPTRHGQDTCSVKVPWVLIASNVIEPMIKELTEHLQKQGFEV